MGKAERQSGPHLFTAPTPEASSRNFLHVSLSPGKAAVTSASALPGASQGRAQKPPPWKDPARLARPRPPARRVCRLRWTLPVVPTASAWRTTPRGRRRAAGSRRRGSTSGGTRPPTGTPLGAPGPARGVRQRALRSARLLSSGVRREQREQVQALLPPVSWGEVPSQTPKGAGGTPLRAGHTVPVRGRPASSAPSPGPGGLSLG